MATRQPATDTPPVQPEASPTEATPPKTAIIEKELIAKWKEEPPKKPAPSQPFGGATAQGFTPLSAVRQEERLTNLEEWLDYWKDATGYSMFVTREADAPPIPGQPALFRRATPATPGSGEPLGRYAFRPNAVQFIADVQLINGNSGGNIRVTLTDETGEPVLSYDVNGVWRGVIPNPLTVPGANGQQSGQQQQQRPKEKTLLEQLTELNALQEQFSKLRGEKPDDGTDLVKQLTSGVLPAVAGGMVTMITSTAQAAMEAARQGAGATPAEQPGESIGAMVIKRVLDDDRMQDKFFHVAERGIDALGGLFTGRREARQIKDTSPPAQQQTASQQTSPAQQAQSEGEPQQQQGVNVLDYVLARCEANQPLSLQHDEVMKQFAAEHPVEYTKFVGGLKMLSFDGFVAELVRAADETGKGEKARAVAALPHAEAFVKYMRKSLDKQ
jgi:hypothetical protein